MLQKQREILFRQLNFRVSVLRANPKIRKSEAVQEGFRCFGRSKLFRRYFFIGRNSRGEAGIGRLIPCKQVRFTGKFSDFFLCQSAVTQRGEDGQLLKRLCSRTGSGVIGCVGAVQKNRKAVL